MNPGSACAPERAPDPFVAPGWRRAVEDLQRRVRELESENTRLRALAGVGDGRALLEELVAIATDPIDWQESGRFDSAASWRGLRLTLAAYGAIVRAEVSWGADGPAGAAGLSFITSTQMELALLFAEALARQVAARDALRAAGVTWWDDGREVLARG